MLMADKTQLEAIQNETQKGKKKKRLKRLIELQLTARILEAV